MVLACQNFLRVGLSCIALLPNCSHYKWKGLYIHVKSYKCFLEYINCGDIAGRWMPYMPCKTKWGLQELFKALSCDILCNCQYSLKGIKNGKGVWLMSRCPSHWNSKNWLELFSDMTLCTGGRIQGCRR